MCSFKTDLPDYSPKRPLWRKVKLYNCFTLNKSESFIMETQALRLGQSRAQDTASASSSTSEAAAARAEGAW